MVSHADGTFSLYDHLRAGSLAVGVGDAIRAGQLLGRVGNSGNTSEPHLHLQVQTTRDLDPSRAISIPMVFGDLVVNEAHVDRGELPGRVLVRRRRPLA
jgi:murein DD-endopeptidase MepM/ murein hydrolase activator NlpD